MQRRRHVALAQHLAKASAAALVALGAFSAGCSSDDPADPPDDPADASDTADPEDAGENGDVDAPEDHEVDFEIVAEELEHPWGMTFLPDGDALVTERPGRLNRVDLDTGDVTVIDEGPDDVFTPEGPGVQGGLLDVELHPDFEDNRWVYLTYAGVVAGGQATHLGRGQLGGGALENFEILHNVDPAIDADRHFGSRVVFDDDGYVYYTTGDRGQRDPSQDRSNAIGTTLRLEDDGELPDDNPFVGEDDVEPYIYSYGHRNVQGMAVHPETGRIWQNEHGPSGGDEINLPEAGGNFGWPIATYGVEYSGGDPIGDEPHEVDETVDPIHHWEARDSYAPSGMAFYEGDVFPAWEGDLFMGSLAKQYLSYFPVDGESVGDEQRLFEEQNWRVRAVEVGPDGYIYLLVDSGSAPLVRVVPADE